ncbi:MAG: aminotransferase class V-fold PLP-dependent enzyme [Erysipelotrichaceae bacterium]|nr:aminotransferase class V-fold PLP-dependent enzyme [Erysipelotrichaceae bacterium]
MIYLDNAATTRICDVAYEAMLPYLKENYGNPSSIYKLGRSNHQAIENARKQIALLLKVSPAEIYFTSCGSEADNWAMRGIMQAYKKTR